MHFHVNECEELLKGTIGRRGKIERVVEVGNGSVGLSLCYM